MEDIARDSAGLVKYKFSSSKHDDLEFERSGSPSDLLRLAYWLGIDALVDLSDELSRARRGVSGSG